MAAGYLERGVDVSAFGQFADVFADVFAVLGPLERDSGRGDGGVRLDFLGRRRQSKVFFPVPAYAPVSRIKEIEAFTF